MNLEHEGIETGAVLSTLGSIARELTAKLALIDEADEVLKKATVRLVLPEVIDRTVKKGLQAGGDVRIPAIAVGRFSRLPLELA